MGETTSEYKVNVNIPMSWLCCGCGAVWMLVWGGLCPEPLLLAELSLDSIDTVSEKALSLSGLSVRNPAIQYWHISRRTQVSR